VRRWIISENNRRATVQNYITWGRKQDPVSETGKVKKVKLSLCLTNYALRREGVWGSRCIDPYFLDLGTSWRWVVNFTPRPLYPQGKSPWYPLDRRLGGPHGRRGEEKILDPMTDNVEESVTARLNQVHCLLPPDCVTVGPVVRTLQDLRRFFKQIPQPSWLKQWHFWLAFGRC
jgi:hypothetical protein